MYLTRMISLNTNPEIWPDDAFNRFIEYIKDDYNRGGPVTRQFQWNNVSKLIQDVLDGKIIVLKPLTE